MPLGDDGPLPSVLLVDDDPALLRAFKRLLEADGYAVQTAGDGIEAVALLETARFDVVLSDIDMPRLDGIGVLRAVRASDWDLPVVLITGKPDVRTAIEAVELGALRYLVKPVERAELLATMQRATQLRQLAALKRQALELYGAERFQISDRAGLEEVFHRAIEALFMAYQPIVNFAQRHIYAFEALVRSAEPRMPGPGALFAAAEQLHGLDRLGRAIRGKVATMIETTAGLHVFVNLHPNDLNDEQLYDPASPLSRVADRVVLEMTERAALHDIPDARTKLARLRRLGYLIAVDDLGSGYAGLASFVQLDPDVVKLDISLVRDIHKNPTKRRLVQSMLAVCADMGLLLVAEGVESVDERDVLCEIGCNFLQGYLFARPQAAPPEVTW